VVQKTSLCRTWGELDLQEFVGEGVHIPNNAGLVLFEEDYGDGVLCLVDESDSDEEGGILSSLGSYLVGELGHSDWVVQCSKAIYPIVGLSCEGKKLQLLALLTSFEEECRIKVMAALSSCGSRFRRELKILECVQSTTMLEVSTLVVVKARHFQCFCEAKDFLLECERVERGEKNV
jgi:hypothetical protein